MKRVIYWLIGMFFPERCMLCRSFLKDGEADLCHSCRTETIEYPYGNAVPAPFGKNNLHFLDSFTAVWYYEGNVRKSIHRYKFQRAVSLAPRFGRLLGMKILMQGPQQPDILTWVPVSRLRRMRRGYDQCEILAKSVGAELGLVPQSILKKVRHTPPQSGISEPEKRKANVLGAFALKKGVDVRGKVILLLDDVFTTGATTEECARVLLTAGAKEVHCAAIARTRKK